MTSPNFDIVIDEVINVLSDIMQSGEEISDTLLNALADELEFLINKSRSKIGQPTGPPFQPPEGADLLWILAGGNPEAFISYLDTFPNEILNQISNNPSGLNRLIDYLQRNFPQGIPGSADGIKQAPLRSSNIYGFNYDPRSGKLRVRFQEGNIYEYDGVPPEVFKIFAHGAIPAKTTGKNKYGMWYQGKIPSLGAAFYQLIRLGGYPYRKIK